MKNLFFLFIFLLLFQLTWAQSQSSPVEKKVARKGKQAAEGNVNPSSTKQTKQLRKAFTNSSVPANLWIEHHQGDISIIGYSEKEVKIEASMDMLNLDNQQDSLFQLEEGNNTMILKTQEKINEKTGKIDLTIQVPEKTSVKIKLKKGGKIKVQETSRLVEIDNTEGEIELKDLRGWAIISTVNGNIKGNFIEVIPNKPMSFMAFNGGVYLQFPPDLQANFRLKSNSNKIESDYKNVIVLDSLYQNQGMVSPNNVSQQTNLLRNEDINLEETKRNVENRARGGEPMDKKDKNLLNEPNNAPELNKSTEINDLKNVNKKTYNQHPKRVYRVADNYQNRANNGTVVFFISTRNGEIQIRKNSITAPSYKK